MLTRAACALGAMPERVLTVPMGVDPAPYRAARSAAEARPGGAPLVVTTRKLESVYDVGTLIGALPELWRLAPEVEVTVVGDGPERAGLERAARAAAGTRAGRKRRRSTGRSGPDRKT